MSLLEELAGAKADALKRLDVSPSCGSISFPAIEADIYVPGLLNGSVATFERDR